MGTHQYPQAAVTFAEKIVEPAVASRLVQTGWCWKAPYFLLSARQLNAIRSHFGHRVNESELPRFVEDIFSKVLPQIHYEFTSDGFHLALGGRKNARTIVVKELPRCTHGYMQPYRRESYKAALQSVQGLLTWALASYREMSGGKKWPIGEWGGADLVHGELYRLIKGLGEFSYCRTSSVIEFIHTAAPALREEWEAEGLTLIPRYHAQHNGHQRFTTLCLVLKDPV